MDLRASIKRLDIPDVPAHAWPIAFVLATLLVYGTALGRLLNERPRPVLAPEQTVTVTCPLPLSGEALVITIGSDGERHCHVDTGRRR